MYALTHDIVKTVDPRVESIVTISNHYQKKRKTRLTYNCAHLRSTKESLIIEYLRWKLYWIFWVKTFLVNIFLGENFWDENSLGKNFLGKNFLGENLLGENFLGENFWVKFFWVKFFG